MKALKILSVIALLLIIIPATYQLSENLSKEKLPAIKSFSDLTQYQKFWPQAKSYQKDNSQAYTEIFKDIKKQKLLGYAFLSLDVAPYDIGYGGPIKFLTAVDSTGKIIKLELINHNETPELIKDIDSFITQFIGKTFKNEFKLGNDIDGITRATITSKAITTTVRTGMSILSEKEFQGKSITQKEQDALDLTALLIPLALFFLAFLSVTFHSQILR